MPFTPTHLRKTEDMQRDGVSRTLRLESDPDRIPRDSETVQDLCAGRKYEDLLVFPLALDDRRKG